MTTDNESKGAPPTSETPDAETREVLALLDDVIRLEGRALKESERIAAIWGESTEPHAARYATSCLGEVAKHTERARLLQVARDRLAENASLSSRLQAGAALAGAEIRVLEARLQESEQEAERRSAVHLSRHVRLSKAIGTDPGYSVDGTIDEAISRLAASEARVEEAFQQAHKLRGGLTNLAASHHHFRGYFEQANEICITLKPDPLAASSSLRGQT